jgi:hypothetical protein
MTFIICGEPVIFSDILYLRYNDSWKYLFCDVERWTRTIYF